MATVFYCNMMKRDDGVIYSDIHKSDGRMYSTDIDANRALLFDDYAQYKHTVEMVALTRAEYDELAKGK